MTDVMNLFAGEVVGNTVNLTVLLDGLNTTGSFASGDKIALGNTDQRINIALADSTDYTIDTLTFDQNVLTGGINPGNKSAWLALKANPTAKSTTKWSMTLTESTSMQGPTTITIDPIVQPDPDKQGGPSIEILNGILPGR